MTVDQWLYGLKVRSDIDLHQNRRAPTGLAVDVRIFSGAEVPRTMGTPEGRTLVHLEYEEPYYTFAEHPDGSSLLRFYRSCEFAVSPDLREVVVHPVRGRRPGVEVVLTAGAMLAYQLYRRGCLVLHASAVDVQGAAIAFVGNVGMGKSTMAALMCAGGARLITDDVLAVDVGKHHSVVRLGATEVRLRKGADVLLDRFAGRLPGRRTSADDRQVLQLPNDASELLPLGAIVIPQPTRDASTVRVQRLANKEALMALLNFPRILGWQDNTVLVRQFALLSEMVPLVPIVVAHVPWGPPFPPCLASELLEALWGEVGDRNGRHGVT